MPDPEGDEFDWRALIGIALRVARRIVAWDQAEEIAQEAAVDVWRMARRVRDPVAYVKKAAFHGAMTLKRSERRRAARERAFLDRELLLRSRRRLPTAVWIELRRLNPTEKILAALLKAGCTVREIGTRLGLSKSAVQRRIEALRRQFGRVPSPGTGSGRRTSRTSRPTIWKKRSA